ncbi:cytochrome c family protein, partial [bacterium]|nr:cytochrome c family protein [bacterium]
MKRLSPLAVVLILGLLAAPGVAAALPSMPSSTFAASTSCGCHSAFIEDWRLSMHAKALSDPLYVLKLEEASAATDGALVGFCTQCHAPVAVMAGEISGTDSSGASAVGAEGVGCDFCHHVTGTVGAIGNASVEVATDAYKRAQLKDPQAPHAAAYEPFHETAEFCGNCHNVDHPVNGMHLEATYTEWKNGPYSAESIVCQDCHMTPGPGVTKPNPGKAAGMGPERDHIYT